MPSIKVAHIITRLSNGGPADDVTISASGLEQRGYHCTILAGMSRPPEVSAEDKARRLGLRLIIIPELTAVAGSQEFAIFRNILAFYKLYQAIRGQGYSIVHTHTSKAGILGRLAARIAGVPIVVHRTHGHVFYGYPYGRIMTKIYIALERFAALFTDRIITLTEREVWEHVQLGVAPRTKFVAIPSGVRLEGFSESSVDPGRLKESLSIPEGCRVIGCVGRLTYPKGHRVLIEAAALLVQDIPHVRFLIVGDGELTEEIQSLVLAKGLKGNVSFLGWRDDVPDLLRIMDLFVLASLNEGMGRVLVEAMAAGRPIVATRTGGIPDVVQDGKTGILVPPGDPHRLAQAMKLLLNNQELASRMGEEGTRRAKEFSSEAMIESIQQLYEQLLREKKIFCRP